MFKVFTTGLIVLLVAIVAGIIGGVGVCAYFYQEGRKKRQIRPLEAENLPRMVEPFDTKKLWERGKKKPVTLTNDGTNSRTDSEFGVNPSSEITCDPPPPPPPPEQQQSQPDQQQPDSTQCAPKTTTPPPTAVAIS